MLIAWTIFLWLSRVRNVMANEDLTGGGRAVRLGVVVIFIVLALAVAVARVRNRWPQALVVFVIWTVGYWLVRIAGILIDGEYSVGFKVVHSFLMVVSVTLSALTARQEWRGR